VHVDLPGVGNNMQDHLQVTTVVTTVATTVMHLFKSISTFLSPTFLSPTFLRPTFLRPTCLSGMLLPPSFYCPPLTDSLCIQA
jgi:hypothetical protein